MIAAGALEFLFAFFEFKSFGRFQLSGVLVLSLKVQLTTENQQLATFLKDLKG